MTDTSKYSETETERDDDDEHYLTAHSFYIRKTVKQTNRQTDKQTEKDRKRETAKGEGEKAESKKRTALLTGISRSLSISCLCFTPITDRPWSIYNWTINKK